MVLVTLTLVSAVVPILALMLVKAELSVFRKLDPVMVTLTVSVLFTPDDGDMAVTVGAGAESTMIGPKCSVVVQLLVVSTARMWRYQVLSVRVLVTVVPVRFPDMDSVGFFVAVMVVSLVLSQTYV